jgi:transcriptional regulator with AAA-type ATPase domain
MTVRLVERSTWLAHPMPRPLAPGRFLLRMLQQSATPLFAIDSQRQIVFASQSLGAWLGVQPEELIRLRCDYQASGENPLALVAAGLCPPPEAFAGHVEDGFVSRLAGDDRPFERRRARFWRLSGQENDSGLLLVLVSSQTGPHESHPDDELAPERLHSLLLQLRHNLGKRFHISQLIGESDAIARVREQVRVATMARPRVLVVGPPGSGREHVARTIQYAQNVTSVGPLLPIACPLVDAEAMQAALASLLRRQQQGAPDHPATALLLDVDRLQPDAQQELAGFLQLPNIGLHTLATSRVPLVRLSAKGKFRPDLAYALSSMTISLPPLKKRPADIPLLAQHFLEQANEAAGKQFSGLQPAAMELLIALPWSGNVDELAQAIREAREQAHGPQLAATDLPHWVHLAKSAPAGAPRRERSIRIDAFLAQIEKELLARALRAARGNKSKAAQLLGINRPRLLRRLSQLGLIGPPVPAENVIFQPFPDESS